MADTNIVKWNNKDGIITLHNNGSQNRLVLKRYDFLFSFIDEMSRVLGNEVVLMVFRKVLEKFNAPQEMRDKANVETAGAFVDSLIVPVDTQNSAIPKTVTWDGKTRNVDFLGTTHWRVLPNSFIHNFRSALYETLTENGTKAIVREATKRAGLALAEQAMVNYQWKNIDDLAADQDEKIYLGTFRNVGWSYSRVFSKKGADGNHMFLAKITNSYESDGQAGKLQKPTCIWLMNYMDGFYSGVLSKLGGKFVETREVRCRAMGDPYCAFAHKIKDDKKEILDWKELENEWRELDAVSLPAAE